MPRAVCVWFLLFLSDVEYVGVCVPPDPCKCLWHQELARAIIWGSRHGGRRSSTNSLRAAAVPTAVSASMLRSAAQRRGTDLPVAAATGISVSLLAGDDARAAHTLLLLLPCPFRSVASDDLAYRTRT